MDFKHVVEKLLSEFQKTDIRYALMGKEREELGQSALSPSLKADMRYLADHWYNPLIVDGEVDMDRVIEFLTAYNEFPNHEPRPFTPIADGNMKL